MAFVDASRKANLGSSLSHSCNANCYTEVRSQKRVMLGTPSSNLPIVSRRKQEEEEEG